MMAHLGHLERHMPRWGTRTPHPVGESSGGPNQPRVQAGQQACRPFPPCPPRGKGAPALWPDEEAPRLVVFGEPPPRPLAAVFQLVGWQIRHYEKEAWAGAGAHCEGLRLEALEASKGADFVWVATSRAYCLAGGRQCTTDGTQPGPYDAKGSGQGGS